MPGGIRRKLSTSSYFSSQHHKKGFWLLDFENNFRYTTIYGILSTNHVPSQYISTTIYGGSLIFYAWAEGIATTYDEQQTPTEVRRQS
jgi:hypothetical protein